MLISVELTGVNSAQLKITHIVGGLLNFKDAMVAIGRSFKQYYGTMPFASKGTIYGEEWAPLDPQYRSWKARVFPGKPTLVRTGELSSGFEFTATGNSVKIGNQVEYFDKHQLGEGVPQRIIMALNRNRAQAAYDILAKDIAQKVSRA